MFIFTGLFIIYINLGLYALISILIWSIVFFLSNFLVGINPSREMKIIRILSILVIVFILYYNSVQLPIITSLIFPFSINKITFLDELEISKDVEGNPSSIFYISNTNFTWFHFCDFQDVQDLLDILDHNKTYVVTFDLITDKSAFELGNPSLILGSPIVITKKSNPWLITKYLVERIRLANWTYRLEYDNKNRPGVIVKYKELYLYI